MPEYVISVFPLRTATLSAITAAARPGRIFRIGVPGATDNSV
ncbi:MAG: hypothetical protein ACPLSY_04930 [Moorellaceae bacterium]